MFLWSSRAVVLVGHCRKVMFPFYCLEIIEEEAYLCVCSSCDIVQTLLSNPSYVDVNIIPKLFFQARIHSTSYIRIIHLNNSYIFLLSRHGGGLSCRCFLLQLISSSILATDTFLLLTGFFLALTTSRVSYVPFELFFTCVFDFRNECFHS